MMLYYSLNDKLLFFTYRKYVDIKYYAYGMISHTYRNDGLFRLFDSNGDIAQESYIDINPNPQSNQIQNTRDQS